MQPYEPSRSHRSHDGRSPIPGMRAAYGALRRPSQTPIYDALYAEWRMLFRALPGDRTGEENLRFEGFGTVRGTGTGTWGGEWYQCGGPLPSLPPAASDRDY
ncbi:hypothetical protein [Streptomyces xiaopingdaonensis]|uniref:hypothetical protein n=1 Tax=Streptomyces xiaopingdaonensis TaxID=1565415 RepID=UPI003078AC7F